MSSAPSVQARDVAEALAREVLSVHAATVDRDATFPAASIAAIADAGLLAAVVPVTAGGSGLDLGELAGVASALARGCGSTAMIWAMHQLQLACALRHGAAASPVLAGMLADIVAGRQLIASVTSERGLGGDLFRSGAAVRRTPRGCLLEKDAPTVSYGEAAGAFLISARRDPEAAKEDQVAALIRAAEVELEPAGEWNPMGMRGTSSPGFVLRARFAEEQILADPFALVARNTLIPLSNLLWSAVWIGLADEALDRAARCLAGRRPVPADPRIAWADQMLIGLDAQLDAAVAAFRPVWSGGHSTARLRSRLTALKLAASTTSVVIAQHALAICGFAGYQESGPLSVARLLRDLYSAQVMVSNDRLLGINAAEAIRDRTAPRSTEDVRS
jgi:acyl-CoA dehydrogenase